MDDKKYDLKCIFCELNWQDYHNDYAHENFIEKNKISHTICDECAEKLSDILLRVVDYKGIIDKKFSELRIEMNIRLNNVENSIASHAIGVQNVYDKFNNILEELENKKNDDEEFRLEMAEYIRKRFKKIKV